LPSEALVVTGKTKPFRLKPQTKSLNETPRTFVFVRSFKLKISTDCLSMLTMYNKASTVKYLIFYDATSVEDSITG